MRNWAAAEIELPGIGGERRRITLDGVALDAAYTYGLMNLVDLEWDVRNTFDIDFENGEFHGRQPTRCDPPASSADKAAAWDRCHREVYDDPTSVDTAYRTARREPPRAFRRSRSTSPTGIAPGSIGSSASRKARSASRAVASRSPTTPTTARSAGPGGRGAPGGLLRGHDRRR